MHLPVTHPQPQSCGRDGNGLPRGQAAGSCRWHLTAPPVPRAAQGGAASGSGDAAVRSAEGGADCWHPPRAGDALGASPQPGGAGAVRWRCPLPGRLPGRSGAPGAGAAGFPPAATLCRGSHRSSPAAGPARPPAAPRGRLSFTAASRRGAAAVWGCKKAVTAEGFRAERSERALLRALTAGFYSAGVGGCFSLRR